jgi:predicted nucleic acid-binding protein
MYLVVDTWVWEKAQRGESLISLELLAKIYRKCEHKIIYDYDGEILDEYKNHIRELPIIRMFRLMTQTGKMMPRSKGDIEIKDFDRSDLKFIQVAITTPNTLIISGNSDFLELKKHLEKNKKLKEVKILTPEEALNIL